MHIKFEVHQARHQNSKNAQSHEEKSKINRIQNKKPRNQSESLSTPQQENRFQSVIYEKRGRDGQ